MPFNVNGNILTNLQIKNYNEANIVRSNLSNFFDAYNVTSYPGSGTTWTNIGSNSYNLTLTNGPTFTPSQRSSILFDGTNDYASASTSLASLGTGNFTVECWWKSNGSPSSYTSILSQGFTGSPSNGAWAFKVAHTTSVFNFTYVSGGIVDNVSSTNVSDDTWKHLVATRSGTSIILYVNGASVYSFSLPSNYSFGTGETTYIAYNPRDNVYLKGYLGSFTIYGSALSAAEVIQNFNANRRRFGV